MEEIGMNYKYVNSGCDVWYMCIHNYADITDRRLHSIYMHSCKIIVFKLT